MLLCVYMCVRVIYVSATVKGIQVTTWSGLGRLQTHMTLVTLDVRLVLTSKYEQQGGDILSEDEAAVG